jgi:CheY-like chemotaxis protein
LLQNLVSNALKYTLKGAVLVGCRRTGSSVRIEIWDTGLGIPEDRQQAVFEEFQRLDQGARVARGLGLGLSIVERLARVLGHRVGLVSRPGKGSVFSVTAPIGEAQPVAVEEREPARPAAAGEPLNGLKVLAIDNEPRVLEGMRLLMSRWGCAVATAHGVAEARAAVAASAPDIVIADYHLDDGDGIEAIRAVRENLGRATPAILATADRSPEVRDLAQREDIIILNKPLKPAPLRAQLTRYSAMREAAE